MMNQSTSTDDRYRLVDKSVYLVIECLGPGHVGYHSEVVVRPDGRWEINKYPIPVSYEFNESTLYIDGNEISR